MWEKLPGYLNGLESKFVVDENWLSDSYRRCQTVGVSPHTGRPRDILLGEALATFLQQFESLCAFASSVFPDLHENLCDQRQVFLLTDPEARILYVYSRPEVLISCYKKRIRPGASLAEESVGTNAVSLALRYRQPIILRGPKHFSHLFHNWFCVAVPVVGVEGELKACLNISICMKTDLGEKMALARLLAEKFERALVSTTSSTTSIPANTQLPFKLTQRQLDVIRLRAEGNLNKEIASILGIRPDTVEEHVAAILRKSGARSVEQVIALLYSTPLFQKGGLY